MEKLVIYQVLPRLFGNKNIRRIPLGTLTENGTGKFQDFDSKTLRRIKQFGATHIWFTGVLRHATTTDYTSYSLPTQHPSVVKGKAGSPYAVCDYYDVAPDLAVDVNKRMAEFEALVERTHKAGLKVIIDFVPNHVARQYCSQVKPEGVEDIGENDDKSLHFSPKNNFYYCVNTPFVAPMGGDYEEIPAKATGNDCFSAQPTVNDWYETAKLNYGIDYNDWSGVPSKHFSPTPALWDKMTNILLFWASKNVDGFRCDMAEMVPAEFWDYATKKVKKQFPRIIFIGEVYDPRQYRNYIYSGFDYLYDKVGMYDTLRCVITCGCPTSEITARWQETDDIRDRMLYFLENHDEQRIASDFFAKDARKAVPAFIISALLGKNPVMVYAGQEFAESGMDCEGFSRQDGRTTIFDYWCVESIRRGFYDRRKLSPFQREMENQYKAILNIALSEKDILEGEMFDLMYVNPHLQTKQFAFLRGKGMLVVVNFDGRETTLPIFLPAHAFDFLHMKEGEVKAHDLLTNEAFTLSLQKDTSLSVLLPASGGVVLKW